MEVRYERPSPDLTHTVAAPLLLDIGDRRGVWIERWCLDGIEPPNESFGAVEGAACLTIPFQGFGITFRVCLRPDRERNLLRFDGLGVREQRVLRHFYRALVTGRAVPMERMITAMDTPVDLVPMEQTPEEHVAEPRTVLPRAARVAMVVGLYAVLAVLAYGPILAPVAQEVQRHLSPAVEYAER